ncbi:hypothetical protein [Agrobacterium sp. CG674]
MPTFTRHRMHSAFAFTSNTFCAVFNGNDSDDSHSYILTYEGNLKQPWSRADVPRKIDGLTGKLDSEGRPVIYAVSDEGDVYTIWPGKASQHMKIIGAGVYSEGATGLGYINSATLVDDMILVAGYHSQLYRIAGEKTEWFHKEKLPSAPQGFEYLAFGTVRGTTDTDTYMSVVYFPENSARGLTDEEKKRRSELIKEGRYEEALDLEESTKEGQTRVNEGRLHHWDGNEWRVVATPRSGKFYSEPAVLSDILIENKDRVWAVGNNGVILFGNARDGFQDISFKGNDENLRSITQFRDRMVIASDYALHWFDGHILTPLKPVLDPNINKSIPTPLKVQAVGDILYYFDSKHGIQTFDGNDWKAVEVPQELLEREFKGTEN